MRLCCTRQRYCCLNSIAVVVITATNVVSIEFSKLLSTCSSLFLRLQNCDQKSCFVKYRENYWKLCTASTIGLFIICEPANMGVYIQKPSLQTHQKPKEIETPTNLFNKIKWENHIPRYSFRRDKLILVCDNGFLKGRFANWLHINNW